MVGTVPMISGTLIKILKEIGCREMDVFVCFCMKCREMDVFVCYCMFLYVDGGEHRVAIGLPYGWDRVAIGLG